MCRDVASNRATEQCILFLSELLNRLIHMKKHIYIHTYSSRQHITYTYNNAYAITNSTTKWKKKYKEGSYDNFRGNSLHPHMTCIWISIKKERTIQIHTLTRTHCRKLYCFFMHIDFLFLLSIRSFCSLSLPLLSWRFQTCRIISNKIFAFLCICQAGMQYGFFYDKKQQSKIDNLCKNALVMATDLPIFLRFHISFIVNFLYRYYKRSTHKSSVNATSHAQCTILFHRETCHSYCYGKCRKML